MNIPLLSSVQSTPAPSAKFLTSQGNPQQAAAGETTSAAPAARPQTALEVVEQTLKRAYEKLGLRWDSVGEKGASRYAGFEPLSAEKVAGNILGFIERRLLLDAQEGATPEQLQSRLEAGLSGFKQGFAEAREKLEALNLLSEGVAADIGRTYDLVLEGIDALRARFLPDLLQDTSSTAVTPASVPENAKTLPSGGSSLSVAGRYDYVASNRFQFELVTAEGDRVNISASSLEQKSLSFGAAFADSGNGFTRSLEAQASQSRVSSVEWRVEGDLSEAELGAIGSLLERMDRLAREFFQGNLDQAFNQALSLGYDDKQIASFSLNLTQVEVQRVSSAYRAVSGSDSIPEGLGDLRPLGQFVRQLLDLVDSLSEVAAPRQLLLDIAEQLPSTHVNEEFKPGEVFRDFVAQMLNSLDR